MLLIPGISKDAEAPPIPDHDDPWISGVELMLHRLQEMVFMATSVDDAPATPYYIKLGKLVFPGDDAPAITSEGIAPIPGDMPRCLHQYPLLLRVEQVVSTRRL